MIYKNGIISRTGKSRKDISMIIMIITVMILTSADIHALGITPSKKILDYNPVLANPDGSFDTISGYENYWTIESRIINTEHKDMTLKIEAEGELSRYVKITESSIHLGSDEDEKSFSYVINLPVGLNPGTHTVLIGISEESSGQNNRLGGLLKISQQIDINVPHQGLYAQGHVSVLTAEPGSPSTFSINIQNRGNENIKSIEGSLEITDSSGNIIKDIKINKYNDLFPGTSSKMEDQIVIKDAGLYHAQYLISYDGKNFTAETEFKVGRINVMIKDMKIDEFKLGSIARIDLGIEKAWNSPIDGVYANITIKDKDNNTITTLTTEKISISAKNDLLSTYWDTKDIKQGDYNIGVEVYAADTMNARQYPSVIEENKITIGEVSKEQKMTYKWQIAALLLILAGIGVIIVIKDSKKDKRRKTKTL